MKCDVDVCKELHTNVAFPAGTMMFTGIGECITTEFKALAKSTFQQM